jgi:micrococcal nuclease
MDGDTIELRVVTTDSRARSRLGKNLRIRLEHIDCPEYSTPFFRNAKKFTSDNCFRQKVKILHKNQYDRYGRLIGEVLLPNGKILNQELVKMGLAKHFKKYSSSSLYSRLEIEARVKKIGIWSL